MQTIIKQRITGLLSKNILKMTYTGTRSTCSQTTKVTLVQTHLCQSLSSVVTDHGSNQITAGLK